MNSFISWVGGKKAIRKEIIKNFPKNYEEYRYIEVFGGAGWVLFGKEVSKLEVFNDADDNLITLFKCAKYHSEELVKEMNTMLISRTNFFHHKELSYQNGLTDIQRAARYFYIIKNSFGSGKRSFATAKNTFPRSVEYLSCVRERLKDVVIENLDFEQLIKTYDRKQALFYLDPPYHNTEMYYESKFRESDHERLSNVLKNVKGKFILSYNDDEYIRELYKDFFMFEVKRKNNLSANKMVEEFRELVIKNYK